MLGCAHGMDFYEEISWKVSNWKTGDETGENIRMKFRKLGFNVQR
jgi:hypothetical protein